jgi:formylmethanofuran dehydrogenase subunit E
MKGSYAVRSARLLPLYKQATEAKSMFDRVTFTSLPREDPTIQKADALANEALDGKIPSSPVGSRLEAYVKPIGIVSSPYKVQSDAPRQGRLDPVESRIEIYPEYEGGLAGLLDYDKLFIFCWFDKSRRDQLRVERPGRGGARGVFATRSPNRPNPIGLTLVDLLEINGRILRVRGLDALDRTPILDIKPYEPDLDSQ